MSGQGGQQGAGNQGDSSDKREVTLYSAWTSENCNDYVQDMLDSFTVAEEESTVGLIDVSRAPAVVLQALPGVTEELAADIAAAAQSRDGTDVSAAWLLLEDLVTVEEFRQIEPWVTTTGRVFHLESVGYFAGSGPMVRIEAVIDATGSIPQIVSRRVLTSLGSGYSLESLGGSLRKGEEAP